MELLASVTVASLAYVYVARLRVARAEPTRICNPAKPEPVSSTSKPAPPAFVIPEQIIQIIEQESEPWAQDERKHEAQVLFAEHGNWRVVAHKMEHE